MTTDKTKKTDQQYTVSIETLRNNHLALRSYLLREYGPQRLAELPDFESAFKGLDPTARVPIQNISMGITVIARYLQEPNLGLKMAEHLAQAHSRVVLFCNNISIRFIDYLSMIARYMRITTEIFDYKVNVDNDYIEFRLIPLSPETNSYHQREGVCALLMRGLRHNDKIRLSQLTFSHSKPSEDDQLYLTTFNLIPTFNQQHCSLFFPIECRDILINGTQKTSDNAGILALQAYEARYSRLNSAACIIERCHFLLPLLLCLNQANKEHLAKLLCLSPRTLQRKLTESQTSFREVLQNVRIELSERYFRETNATCTELGFALGYQDYKQFNRAFKEWFGMSPERYRATMVSR